MGGIHISHMREETVKVLDSVRETIEIGEQGGLPTQVTHHKMIGKANWGRTVETLRLVDEARARGVDATIDQYPVHGVGDGHRLALLPAWALEGGRETDAEAPAGIPASRADILGRNRRDCCRTNAAAATRRTCQLSRCAWNPSLDGKRLGDVTKGRGSASRRFATPPRPRSGLSKAAAAEASITRSTKQDLQRILRHPATMIASDGGVPVFGEGSPASAKLRHVLARARPCTCAS